MFEDLKEEDFSLIQKARDIIKANYDSQDYRHTVGCALRCADGEIYLGVNVYLSHGACAEVIAMGTAITAGKREFESIVAIGGDNSDIIYSPCGNCRQMLMDYCPECYVIINTHEGIKKTKAKNLIPFAYETPSS